MKIKNLLLTSCLTLTAIFAFAQATVNVTVNNAVISTTCTDIFSGPDPLFQVNIENQGWVTYPEQGPCHTALPNEQYVSSAYNCGQDAPLLVNVCFKVFENDGFFGCDIDEQCEEEICENFPLPMAGTGDFTLDLPAGGDSGGSLDFTIDIVGAPLNNVNDEICGAIDLGLLTPGITLGDAAAGAYNNFCATQFNDLDPCDFEGGIQCNVNGVWFSVTTGAEKIMRTDFVALSDPNNIGDNGNGFLLQMAIFEALDGTCDGNFVMVENETDYSDADALFRMDCIKPNTTYYIMIDGAGINTYADTGYFGLEINSTPYEEGANLICNAFDMGNVPLDGSVAIPAPVGNHCADGNFDPNVSSFSTQYSVWFTFSPPPTGHVIVNATSSFADDPIGIELAVFEALNDNCSGPYIEKGSSFDASSNDESLELSCLDPDRTYFILIDGQALENNGRGFFDLSVTDAGNNTPEMTNTDILCAGGSVSVGANIYDVSGFYSDTLPIGGGCIEIINTDLTVLAELIADVVIDDSATGENEPDGAVTITAVGGDGNYMYTWSNGLTISNPTNLLGGENYCVTVTDGNNCEDILCFDMPFIDVIFPTITDGSLLCNGDTNGSVSFFVENGLPPYTYEWADATNTLNGNGDIAGENIDVFLTNLPAGIYDITVSDGIMDTVFFATITEPEALIINDLEQTEVSCFGACDGTISAEVQGGTPPYSVLWSTGEIGNTVEELCAGNYIFTVSDANNCQASANYIITEPIEFIATTSITQNVTCFQGNDGAASVATNGNPIAYLWDTGDETATIDTQIAGTYGVIVTNENGCQDIAEITITEPDAPVGVTLEIVDVITCNGAADASIRSTATGPGTIFSYTWSNGNTNETAGNLPAGTYSVTVENEVGCSATAEIVVDEPTEIIATFSTEDVNCADGELSGKLFIEEITGGEAPYVYSIDGQNFVTTDTIENLSAGPYTFYLEDALGCLKTYEFAILPPPELVVDLGEAQTVLLGETIDIVPIISSQDVVYEWMSSDTLPENCINGNCESLSIQPINTTLITVIATDTLTQCTAEAQVEIMINRARFVYFPNAFSPNDDGNNDKFIMYGARGVQEVKSFRVFDRNGGLMYTNSGFLPGDRSFGWDGFFAGKRMNTGVYVYFAEIIFLDGETEIYKGSITLLR